MKKILSLFIMFMTIMFLYPIIGNAESNYSMKLKFSNKLGVNIISFKVNGKEWNEWESGSNNTFYSDDDKYNISILYANPTGLPVYALYDESWHGKIEESNICVKGCNYLLNVNNSDHKDMLDFSITTGYNVSFETNGGSSIDSKFVEINNKLVKPTNPTKENYIFDGWYKDSGLNELFDFNTPITNDITLYAKWVEDNFSYKFISGNNQKLIAGNIKSFILKIDADYSLFKSIKIGNLDFVKDVDYKVTEGSTIITYTEKGLSKLNSLSKGEYDIDVKYLNDKEVNGKLILTDVENPKTGHSISLYIIFGFISLIVSVLVILFIRKKIFEI